ncbi:MAG: DUF4383 domain-containing protein, partial [Dehalococcoidia bacterium]
MGMARTVAAVFGAVYLLVGLLGFVLVPGGEGDLLGLFPVNALHNIVHVLLGAILLYGATSTPAAIMSLRGVGVVLILLGILGVPFPDGFGLVPLGGADIALHLVTGAI